MFGSLTCFSKAKENLFDPVALQARYALKERPGPPGPYMEGGPSATADTSVFHLATIEVARSRQRCLV